MLCPPPWSCLSLVSSLVSQLLSHLSPYVWDAVFAFLAGLPAQLVSSCLPSCFTVWGLWWCHFALYWRAVTVALFARNTVIPSWRKLQSVSVKQGWLSKRWLHWSSWRTSLPWNEKRKGRGPPKKKPKPAAKKAAAKAEQKDTSDYSMSGCQCSAGVRCVNL